MGDHTTFHVSSVDELHEALASSEQGDVIELAAGNYGDFKFSSYHQYSFNGGVTITSKTPDDPAYFDYILLDYVSDMTFQDVHVQLTPDENSTYLSNAIKILHSNNITFERATITGGLAVNGVPPETDPNDLDSSGNVLGYPVGAAITVHHSDSFMIVDSEISTFRSGITGYYVNGFEVIGTEISHVRTIPVGGANINDVVISNNHFHSQKPWSLGGAGDHGDFIHLYTMPPQTEANKNISITDNFFTNATGVGILGIYLDDDNHGIGFEDVTISNNVLQSGSFQTVRFENVQGAMINNNTFLPGVEDTKANIYLTDNSRNISIVDNILTDVHINRVEDRYLSSIKEHGNYVVQGFSSAVPNYYKDLFVDPSNTDPNPTDFMALPGGVIEQLGVGASMTLFDQTPDKFIAIIDVDYGEKLSANHARFSVDSLFGPSGPVNLDGASVSWSLSDGHTQNGASVEHGFAHAGDYTATATIVLADGTTVVADKTVSVDTPILLKADFAGGVADQSDHMNEVEIADEVRLVTDEGRTAAHLNGGMIAFQNSAELINNTAFTFTIDFRKTAATQSGSLVTFPGSFNIDLSAIGFYGSVTNSAKTQWLKLHEDPIDDTKWHGLTLTFSGDDGSLLLYLDGELIFEDYDHGGAVQKGLISHDLYLGNPWGDSFEGLVDNVSFLSGVLDASEIAALHSGQNTVESLLQLETRSATFTDQVQGKFVDMAYEEDIITVDVSTVKDNIGSEDVIKYVLPDIDKKDLINLDIRGGRLYFDRNEDGESDVDVDLPPDFLNGNFLRSLQTTGVTVSYHSDLFNLVASVAQKVAYISNATDDTDQDGSSDVAIKIDVLDTTTSVLDNALGLYSYDSNGNISDVRVVAESVASVDETLTVNGIDQGKSLGFFILQGDYNRLDLDLLNNTDLSLQVRDGQVKLFDNANEVNGRIFVSHDASLNPDKMDHVITSTDADFTGTLYVGFEEELRSGDGSDDDFQDVMFLIQSDTLVLA